ncbi:MAG: hypothetical protein HYZ42_08095 [Bacteroidetes bacterium]|nr:hypothetical protein [Bacteroidota bacterium]
MSRIVVICFLCLVSALITSQTINTEHFQFKRFSADEGMAVGQINRMAFDKNGLTYFTTEDGLYIFNGSEVERKYKNLVSTRVRRIYNDDSLGILFADDLANQYRLVDNKIVLDSLSFYKDKFRILENGKFRFDGDRNSEGGQTVFNELIFLEAHPIKVSESTFLSNVAGELCEFKNTESQKLFADTLIMFLKLMDTTYLIYNQHRVKVFKNNYSVFNDDAQTSMSKIKLECGLSMKDYYTELVQIEGKSKFYNIAIRDGYIISLSGLPGFKLATYKYHRIIWPSKEGGASYYYGLFKNKVYINIVSDSSLGIKSDILYMNHKGDIFYSIDRQFLKYNSALRKTEILPITAGPCRGAFDIGDKTIIGLSNNICQIDDKSKVMVRKMHYNVNCIFYVRSNRKIIVGTEHGMFTMDTNLNRLVKVKVTEKLNINHIFYDSIINAYILCSPAIGLVLLDSNNQLIPYNQFNQTLTSRIHYIAKDMKGHYWVSSNTAIYKLHASSFSKLLENKNALAPGLVFDIKYFKDIDEFNSNRSPSPYIFDSIPFYFPSMQGLVDFDLKRASSNIALNSPTIYIDKIMGEYKINNGVYIIDPDYNFLSFKANIFYVGPKVFPSLLSYKIEGSDDITWHDLKPNQSISISGLHHGTYQIIVRGQVFGKFSSSQLTFVVSLKPFF